MTFCHQQEGNDAEFRGACKAGHLRLVGRLARCVSGSRPATLAMQSTDSKRLMVIIGEFRYAGAESAPASQRFYPASLPAGERLTHYSRAGVFSCVELDSSTYAIPSPRQMRGWANQV